MVHMLKSLSLMIVFMISDSPASTSMDPTLFSSLMARFIGSPGLQAHRAFKLGGVLSEFFYFLFLQKVRKGEFESIFFSLRHLGDAKLGVFSNISLALLI